MVNKHTKRCLTFVIGEMKIKTTMRQYFTPAGMPLFKKEKQETCWQGCGETGSRGGNVKWYSFCEKQCGSSSKEGKTELPNEQASSLCG